MKEESVYLWLKGQAEYALNSKNLMLAYQAYGAVKMAYRLGAIGKEQFFTLNDMIVTNGINKPPAGLE